MHRTQFSLISGSLECRKRQQDKIERGEGGCDREKSILDTLHLFDHSLPSWNI